MYINLLYFTYVYVYVYSTYVYSKAIEYNVRCISKRKEL